MRLDQDPLGVAYDTSAWQAILNSQPIPPRRQQRDCWLPALARIVWERDGPEVFDTNAFAWVPHGVLVELRDRRYLLRGVWLDPVDVRRR